MVLTISPLVEEANGNRFLLASTLHVLGGIVGGATLGVVAAAVGIYTKLFAVTNIYMYVSILTFAYSLREFGVIRLPLLNAYQVVVPLSWRMKLGPVGAAPFYGLGLGVGFHANTPYSSFHFMLLWMILIHQPLVGVLAGAMYGAIRTAQPLIWGVWLKSSSRIFALVDTLRTNRYIFHRVNGATLAIITLMGIWVYTLM